MRPTSRRAFGPLRRTWRALLAIDRFIRLHFLGFSTMLALLGGASVVADLELGTLAWLLLGALAFHNFAYVLNDVVDLPLDRRAPDRRLDPLVRGQIRPHQALLFVAAQLPLAGLATWGLGGDWRALVALAAGFVSMTIYDLWGKRCPIPPLTDLAQGLGWASLAVWAAFAVGEPTALTWVVAAYGAGFIVLINGVHGGLRDLASDLEGGARTTATFFGTHIVGGKIRRRPALIAFAGSLQLVLIALSLTPLLRRDFGYREPVETATLAAVLLVDTACLVFFVFTMRPNSDTWGRDFRLHLFWLSLVPAVLFVPYLAPLPRLVFLVSNFLPLTLLEVTSEVLSEAWRRLVTGFARVNP